MKVIFVGTSEFGIPSLDMLNSEHDLVLVISQPDRPVGRKKVLTAPPVKDWATKQGIKIIQPEKIIDAAQEIRTLNPDIMVVAAYGQIIPKTVLGLPAKGSINLHGSILPKYRGASPIQSAILNDDKETGVTIIQMDEKMDHGDILSSQQIFIEESDDYFSLHSKLANIAAELLDKTLTEIAAGTIVPKQQDHESATFAKLISREHARIDWTKPGRSILQQIKALNPEPGTWTTLNGKSVKIIKAEEVKNGKIDVPGNIYADGKDCLVKCGDYSLRLVTVQTEGKNPISGHDFWNGLKGLETKLFV